MEKKGLSFKVIVSALLILSFSVPLWADEGGNHDHREDVKQAMQKLYRAFKAAKEHAEKENYYEAANQLMEIARLFKALDKVDPGKGGKKVWDDMHSTTIDLAFKGIGYCGTKDKKKLLDCIKEIGKLQQRGHAKFK